MTNPTKDPNLALTPLARSDSAPQIDRHAAIRAARRPASSLVPRSWSLPSSPDLAISSLCKVW